MSDTPAIEVTGLVKRFGASTALDGVDLVVPQGSVFGFLGLNGAGKTTTLRILTGLARPTSGTARILGHDAGTVDHALRARIGFLPDVPGFYEWMTATELLRFAGRLSGLDGPTLDQRIEALLAMAGLAGVPTRIGGYSRGMKQRLGMAQAMINAPALLLLDEPTSALDPIGRREVLEMVASLRGRATVFFSSHILADVERVSDTVAILDRGRVVASAPVTELKRRAGAERVEIELAGDGAALRPALAGARWLKSIEEAPGGIWRLLVTEPDAAAREIPRAIASAGLGLRRLETLEPSLEDVFVELVGRPRP